MNPETPEKSQEAAPAASPEPAKSHDEAAPGGVAVSSEDTGSQADIPPGAEPVQIEASPEPGADADEPKSLHDQVIEVLQSCYDPEIPVDIYELGLIYKIDVNESGEVKIDMTLTSPACPAAGSLPPEVEQKVGRLDGVASVKVEVVWEPTWTPEKMSEAAKLQLGFF